MASQRIITTFRGALVSSQRSATRPFASTARFASSFLQERPSPPRLPAEQQQEFERLQRAAEAQLHSHTQTTTPSTSTSRHASTPSSTETQTEPEPVQGDGMVTMSGGIRKGAPPEFEGEKNPKTGEVGGPKNEPLRWGGSGDWSYNGRVTDF
ncbi:hypothetical protein B0H66DRAFT_100084 [Apodospora peruviana]|uniref:Succinate dehydrogenase assembly factor 4, mitochondrial n=1 Tax=Apodospora peruviana TaxID=516989 RepID=A0AAE0HSB7_9PEZI|nr:hypothetical protein B0H66DRAFT_100084 [Apodospora peruviana]